MAATILHTQRYPYFYHNAYLMYVLQLTDVQLVINSKSRKHLTEATTILVRVAHFHICSWQAHVLYIVASIVRFAVWMVVTSWKFTSDNLSNRDIIRIYYLLVPFTCFVVLFICIYMYVLFMTSLGEGVVDIIIKEVVMVSLTLPPMTIDDFFGENIISNLAAFLDVPASKIRIVNVVRETSSRKRNTDTTTIQIEIGRLYLSNIIM